MHAQLQVQGACLRSSGDAGLADALTIVDLRFHVADGVGRLHVGHTTPVNVLTKICVQPWEPFYVLLATGRSHLAHACNNHGRPLGSFSKGSIRVNTFLLMMKRSCFWTWDDNEYVWQTRRFQNRQVKRRKVKGKGKRQRWIQKNWQCIPW